MILQHQRFRHDEWDHITKTEARKLLQQQVATSLEMAILILDALEYGEVVDCGTRGKIRRKPHGNRKCE